MPSCRARTSKKLSLWQPRVSSTHTFHMPTYFQHIEEEMETGYECQRKCARYRAVTIRRIPLPTLVIRYICLYSYLYYWAICREMSKVNVEHVPNFEVIFRVTNCSTQPNVVANLVSFGTTEQNLPRNLLLSDCLSLCVLPLCFRSFLQKFLNFNDANALVLSDLLRQCKPSYSLHWSSSHMCDGLVRYRQQHILLKPVDNFVLSCR
jgi:hypothetical protein